MKAEEFLNHPLAMTLREDQKQFTLNNIVRATADLLREGGEEAVTMRAVATMVGVTERTVFRHVKTRDDLLSTVWALLETFTILRPPSTAGGLVKAVRKLFEDIAGEGALVRAYLRRKTAPKVSRRRKAARQQKLVECVQDGLDGIYLDKRSLRRRAAMLDVMASPQAWELLSENWGMNAKQAGEVAAEAIDILLNRRLPI